MGKQDLTDAGVRALKVGAGERIEITDSGSQGLRLRVTATSKAWSYVYRRDGAVHRITIGPYPRVSLKQARDAAKEHAAARLKAEDPHAVKAARKAATKAVVTFAEVTNAYVAHVQTRKASWRNDQLYLRTLVDGWPTLKGKRVRTGQPSDGRREGLGSQDIKSVSQQDIVGLLDDIAKFAPVSANRTQAVLHSFYAWAGPLYGIESNPLGGVRRRGGKERQKDRLLTDAELIALRAALNDPDHRTAKPIRFALQLILLTLARPGEVAGLVSNELHNMAGPEPYWRLPEARTKNRRTHVVPLSTTAVAVIRKAQALRDAGDTGPVFQSKFSKSTIARHSLSQATRRLCEDTGLAPFTPHDLRRTGATLARRLGVSRDVVKAMLNHVEDDITAVYDRHDMLAEKRNAYDLVASFVATLGAKN